jgi:molybdopterin-containing oxidoreductase family iron-sulfur binding subunit
MTRWGMVIDLDRCVGCNACTVACKIENGTPPDQYWARVYTEESGTFPDTKTTYVPALCNHCADAPCVTVCPTGASYKRDDGIVLIDQSKCNGCRACMLACPYGNRFFLRKGGLEAGYYGERTAFEDEKWAAFQEGTVQKCTFCVHRVDRGLEPACVVTCPTDARVFGDLSDPDSEPSRMIRERDGRQPLPELGTDPSVYYVEGKRS